MHKMVRIKGWKCYRTLSGSRRGDPAGIRWASKGAAKVEHLEGDAVLVTLEPAHGSPSAAVTLPLEVVEFVAQGENLS